MEPDQRRKAFILFWGKLFLSLIAVALLYLSLIRPVQSFLLKHYLLPVLETFLDPAGDLMLVHRTDEIEMMFKSAKFPDMKIELPFTGYFWLSPLFLAHQKLYKALFLILSILAVREGALKLDKHASKKL